MNLADKLWAAKAKKALQTPTKKASPSKLSPKTSSPSPKKKSPNKKSPKKKMPYKCPTGCVPASQCGAPSLSPEPPSPDTLPELRPIGGGFKSQGLATMKSLWDKLEAKAAHYDKVYTSEVYDPFAKKSSPGKKSPGKKKASAALAEYKEAAAKATEMNAPSFEFNGSTYVRDNWVNGAPKWKKLSKKASPCMKHKTDPIGCAATAGCRYVQGKKHRYCTASPKGTPKAKPAYALPKLMPIVAAQEIDYAPFGVPTATAQTPKAYKVGKAAVNSYLPLFKPASES